MRRLGCLIALLWVPCFSSDSFAQSFDLAGPTTQTLAVSPGRAPETLLINRIPGQEYKVIIVIETRTVPPIPLPSGLTMLGQVAPQGTSCPEKPFTDWINTIRQATDETVIASTVSDSRIAELRMAYDAACWVLAQEKINQAIERTRETLDLSRYTIQESQQLVVTVTRAAPGGSVKTWTFVLQAPAAGEWLTTWGFGFGNDRDDHFFQKQLADGTFQIAKERDGAASDLRFIPSVFFHWMPRGDQTRDWSFSPLTAGIGVNRDAPAVMLGMSITRRQNLTLIAGPSMMRAKRLDGVYSPDQILKEKIADDKLYQNTYRPGWFVSLAIRFDSNPFTANTKSDSSAGGEGAAKPDAGTKIVATGPPPDPVANAPEANLPALVAHLLADRETPDGVFPDGDAYAAARAALVKIGPSSVSPLLSALASTNPRLRLAATDVLWRINDPRVVDALILALHDPAPEVRVGAAMSLGFRRDPRGTQPLIRALRDPDDRVRTYASVGLGFLNDRQSVEPLIVALSDSSSAVRGAALTTLAGIADRRAVTPIIQRLSDEVEDVRRLAAIRLGDLGDPGAIEPLIERLTDAQESVRVSAATALGKLKAPQAGTRLIALLADNSVSVRAEAATALGLIGHKEAVDPLGRLASDKDPRVQSRAIEALGRIGDPRVIDPLIGTLKSRFPTVRLLAAEALGAFPDPRVVRALAALLSEPDEEMRAAATLSLGRTRVDGAMPLLLTALGDESALVRATAACVLGQLGDPRALGPLQKVMTSDPSPQAQRAAAKAVDRFTGAGAQPGDIRHYCSLLALP